MLNQPGWVSSAQVGDAGGERPKGLTDRGWAWLLMRVGVGESAI